MASLNLCIFFPELSAKYSVTWFDHHELWIEIVFDKTFSVGKYFYMASTLEWAVYNKLQLNNRKTEILLFSSRFRSSTDLPPAMIGDSVVDYCTEARSLGVVFDSELCMKVHVSNICRAGWSFIYRIGRIRSYLDEPATLKLIHAFVTSRIDSCNSLLIGLPTNEINRLQRLQNAAARLVCRVNCTSI